MSAVIRLEEDWREDALIARVIVDHPGKINVIGRAAMAALRAIFTDLGKRSELRAAVLRGAGERAFIGGADIAEMAALEPASAREFITELHGVCAAIRDLPVPVIARLNGFALGAGLEIACSCDLRIAARAARLGMPEVRVGIPSVIEAALLPRLIGWGRAREMVLLGEMITADEAARIGLVARVVDAGALDAAIEDALASLLATGPQAIRLQKALIGQWESLPLAAAVAAGIATFAQSFEGPEPHQMMRRFLAQKRGHGSKGRNSVAGDP